MASGFGTHISNRLREMTNEFPKYGFRDVISADKDIKNPLPFARECVDHYYGLDTDNFNIDLSMEHQHLLYFREHIINHCSDDASKDAIIALNNYMAELMKLNIELNRRKANGEE